jgi:hypothetical protein
MISYTPCFSKTNSAVTLKVARNVALNARGNKRCGCRRAAVALADSGKDCQVAELSCIRSACRNAEQREEREDPAHRQVVRDGSGVVFELRVHRRIPRVDAYRVAVVAEMHFNQASDERLISPIYNDKPPV